MPKNCDRRSSHLIIHYATSFYVSELALLKVGSMPTARWHRPQSIHNRNEEKIQASQEKRQRTQIQVFARNVNMTAVSGVLEHRLGFAVTTCATDVQIRNVNMQIKFKWTGVSTQSLDRKTKRRNLQCKRCLLRRFKLPFFRPSKWMTFYAELKGFCNKNQQNKGFWLQLQK